MLLKGTISCMSRRWISSIVPPGIFTTSPLFSNSSRVTPMAIDIQFRQHRVCLTGSLLYGLLWHLWRFLPCHRFLHWLPRDAPRHKLTGSGCERRILSDVVGKRRHKRLLVHCIVHRWGILARVSLLIVLIPTKVINWWELLKLPEVVLGNELIKVHVHLLIGMPRWSILIEITHPGNTHTTPVTKK